MKNSIRLLILGLIFVMPVHAAEESASSLDELNALRVESNELPPVVDKEKLYSVQTRYNPLKGRFEFGLGGAKNFTPDSNTSSSQMDLSLRYHLSDRWSVSLGGSYVFNSLTTAGRKIFESAAYTGDPIAEVAYPKYRVELLGTYNTFYGKLRFSLDSVVYFDQYLSIGPGVVRLQTADSVGVVGDAGFAFWIGKNFSTRIGIKDYFFEEKRQQSSDWVQHIIGHVEVGYLL